MERRSFIGTIVSAAGAIVAGGVTRLTVSKQEGMVVGVVVFRVHLEDGKQFVFRDVPVTKKQDGMLWMPDCFIGPKDHDYTATRVTVDVPVFGTMLEASFPFTPYRILQGNTLTLQNLRLASGM